MLGLVKLGFAATVYPADARVTSKLPHRLFAMLVMLPLQIFMPARSVRKLFPQMLGAVAPEVSCVLGLVKHGFAATVYPADAQVILRLPGTSDQMCRLALFLTCSFSCVTSVLGVVKTGFAAAVYPADAQVILRLLDTLPMTCAPMPLLDAPHSFDDGCPGAGGRCCARRGREWLCSPGKSSRCQRCCPAAGPHICACLAKCYGLVGGVLSAFRVHVGAWLFSFCSLSRRDCFAAPGQDGGVPSYRSACWSGSPYAGVRVGEASHPGPKAPKGLDLGSLSFLGPGLIDSIKQAIKSLVEQAVQQSLGQVPPKTQPVSAKARRRLKAKARKVSANRRAAGASPPPAPLAPSAARAAPQSKGDGGTPGKGAGKGQGKGKGPNTGNAQPNPPSQEGEWSVVQRRQEPAAEIELRQQDWDSEIVRYEVLASKLEACTGVFKGQLSTARTLLQGSGKPHSVLLIEFCKDAPSDTSNKEPSSQDQSRSPTGAGQGR